MIEIDFKTLILFLVIGNLVTFFFFQFHLYFYNSKIPKLKIYVIARLLQTIAWLANFINLENTDHIYVSIILILVIIGFALEVYVLISTTQNFNQQKLFHLFAIALVGSITYVIVSTNINQRVIVSSFTWTLLLGYLWIDLSLVANRSKLHRAAGWIGFIIAILALNRGIQTFLLETDLIRYSTNFNALPGIGLFVGTIAWPLIFILLHKEQDEQSLLQKDNHIMRSAVELKKMYAAKDRFFRIISHDLRAPMASIISFLELMNQDIKEKNYSNLEKFSRPITQAAHMSLNLLNDLLDYSSTQTDDKKIAIKELKLDDLVHHVIRLFELNFKEKEITLSLDILKDLKVKADEFMLGTVIRNLLSNAIKFTHPKGSIHIKARQDRNNTIIEIQDTGIGISPKKIEMLFNIESNFSSRGTFNEKGTGLGLVLCKEYIELHRGTIEVESELGKGSLFRILLPLTYSD